MKIIKATFILTSLFLAVSVHASDISYSIINSTSTDKVSITVNSIVNRIQHDCSLVTYECLETKEQLSTRIENPLKEISVSILDERDRNATTTPVVSTPTSVTKPDYGVFNVPKNAILITKSPDGKKLAYFVSNSDMIKKHRSFVLLFDDGRVLEKFSLSDSWELLTDTTRLFGFTDDSNKLVYLDDRAGYSQLYMVDLQKDPKNLLGTQLIKRPYMVMDFVVSGDKVYFIANRESSYKWGFYSLDLITQKLEVISSDVMYTNSLLLTDGNILFTKNDSGTGVLQSYKITENKVKDFTGIRQEKVSVYDYKVVSTQNIKGYLIKPEKTKNISKAIIWLHGGPYRQAMPQRHPWGSYATYDWILDEMVASGVTVLKLDYPGSMGYGTKYSLSLVNKIGDVDVVNVSKAVDYLKAQGIKEVYLFGNSYGGYLSAKALVELNSKVSGAVAVSSVTDWQKLVEKVSPTPFEVHFGGTPNSNNQKLYDKSSIVKSLSKLTKPLILLHGDLDKQVPFSQSEYLFREATALNKNVKYYSITNQAHVINGVAQNEAICEKLSSMLSVASTTGLCVMH